MSKPAPNQLMHPPGQAPETPAVSRLRARGPRSAKPRARFSTGSKHQQKFRLYWSAVAAHLPLAEEHAFHPSRRWRFDFAHVPSRTAIELHGAIWAGGRHTRGGGMQADCEKALAAACAGWVVVALVPPMITVPTLEQIAALVERRSGVQSQFSPVSARRQPPAFAAAADDSSACAADAGETNL